MGRRATGVAALTWGARGPALLALAAAVILGSAVASEVWGGLSPCRLCLTQRIPYAFAIVAGLIATMAVVGGVNRRLAALLTFLCTVAFVLGAAVAAYHVGVEQGWWQGSLSCTGVPAGAAATPDELRRLLEAAPVVRCNEVQWSLLGISMAGYNFLASLALAAFAAASARTLVKP